MEVKWGILRGKNKLDYVVWRYFPKAPKYGQVRPMDRLMACWSHLALAKKEGPEVLHKDRKRDKKDVEVMLRLRMLQASCIAVAYGSPFIETAS